MSILSCYYPKVISFIYQTNFESKKIKKKHLIVGEDFVDCVVDSVGATPANVVGLSNELFHFFVVFLFKTAAHKPVGEPSEIGGNIFGKSLVMDISTVVVTDKV